MYLYSHLPAYPESCSLVTTYVVIYLHPLTALNVPGYLLCQAHA